ncbi:hypothetical protein LTR62_008313 [Meristemomyces frigidus]|uniref:Uncharacterized protein n=1 Tax=Meristemomyces frigidus TaxID=1508187 RepID=A0AAN7TKY8_9PEZI|nr:hypothetical protein LTR62_008313 [Meristemomyces frigidus]
MPVVLAHKQDVDLLKSSTSALQSSALSNIAILEKACSFPDCERIATNALINNCASLKRPTESKEQAALGADALVRNQQELYAARMATCELRNTGNPVPRACAPLLPTTHNTIVKVIKGWFGERNEPKLSYPVYEQESADSAPACIRALYKADQGQAWATYEHNRHSLELSCYSARGDIEREEKIEFYSQMMGVSADYLAKSTESIAELDRALERMRMAAAEYQESQQHQLHEMVEAHQGLRAYLQDISGGWAKTLQDVLVSLQKVQTGLGTTEENVAAIVLAAQDLRQQQTELKDTGIALIKQVEQINPDLAATLDQYAVYQMEKFDQKLDQAVGQALQGIHTVAESGKQQLELMVRATVQLNNTINVMVVKIEAIDNGMSNILSWLNWIMSLFGQYVQSLAVGGAGILFFAVVSFVLCQKLLGFAILLNTTISLPTGIALYYLWTNAGHNYNLDAIDQIRKNGVIVLVGLVLLFVMIVASWLVYHVLQRLVVSHKLARNENEQLLLPSSEKQAFRLPVNDPAYMANRMSGQMG